MKTAANCEVFLLVPYVSKRGLLHGCRIHMVPAAAARKQSYLLRTRMS